MTNVIRRYQQPMMIMITILIIIAFVWLYNTTQFEKLGVGSIATIYEKPLTQGDIDRHGREMQVAMRAGLFEYLSNLQAVDQNGPNMEAYVLHSIVTQHESKALQIRATNDDVFQAIKKLPRLQTNGQFDSSKYAAFAQETLAPYGFSTAQFEELIRNYVTLDRLHKLINATVGVSPSEFRKIYEQRFQKVQAELVRFKSADFLAQTSVTDDELKNAFEQNKERFVHPEKRTVKFVSIATPKDDAATEKPDADEAEDDAEDEVAMKKHTEQAEAFAQAMLEAGATFDDVAAKQNLKVELTEEFSSATPPKAFEDEADVVKAASLLTETDPNSDPIQIDGGYAILHLEKLVPATAYTFEEAKAPLTENFKNQRAAELLKNKGVELRGKIATARAAGKSFADAVKELGLTVETPAAFAPGEGPSEAAIPPNALMALAQAGENQLTDFLATPDGGILAFVVKREPLDETKYAEDMKMMMPQFGEARRRAAFAEWLRIARDAANIKATGRDQQG